MKLRASMAPMNLAIQVLDSEHLPPFKETKLIRVCDTKTLGGSLFREGDLGRKGPGTTSISTARRMDLLFHLPIPHILESGG